MEHQELKTWFITGCSTGFGRELAKAVLARGYRAVVTARDPKQVEEITAGHEGRSLILRLDVTDATQVAESVRRAEEHFGHIDVLVNNAGIGYFAAVEESDEAEVRRMFEINFFGLAKMTHAVLPGMRKRRSGHIVNVSSIGGLAAFPGVVYYNATKFAVEGLSEGLAKEVGPLGIKVTLVEPSGFRTDWAGSSMTRATPLEPYEQIDVLSERRRAQAEENNGQQPGNPELAARALLDTLERENPPFRLLLGNVAYDVAVDRYEKRLAEFRAGEAIARGADDR
jgi:NAD(P)-dependent dehydrogenase (short-subunit alcohol dehydrogenase family)